MDVGLSSSLSMLSTIVPLSVFSRPLLLETCPSTSLLLRICPVLLPYDGVSVAEEGEEEAMEEVEEVEVVVVVVEEEAEEEEEEEE